MGRRKNWNNCKQFEKDGFGGLHEDKRSGRPSVCRPDVQHAITKDLHKNPRDLGYNQTMWDGKLLSYHLSHVYGVQLGVRQCQRLFHKLGFRRRKPRPVIAKADPEAQKEYKKTHRVKPK